MGPQRWHGTTRPSRRPLTQPPTRAQRHHRRSQQHPRVPSAESARYPPPRLLHPRMRPQRRRGQPLQHPFVLGKRTKPVPLGPAAVSEHPCVGGSLGPGQPRPPSPATGTLALCRAFLLVQKRCCMRAAAGWRAGRAGFFPAMETTRARRCWNPALTLTPHPPPRPPPPTLRALRPHLPGDG